MNRQLAAVLAALLTLAACDDEGGGGSGAASDDFNGSGAGGSDGSGAGSSQCDSGDYQNDVVAFCEKQFPSEPAAGEFGASCVDDGQCDSELCVDSSFGSHCSMPCGDAECPIGYACEEDFETGFPLCFEEICIYAGMDKADCVTNLLDELDAACESDCDVATTEAWIGCLGGAERLCGTDDASDACGAERGILEACCFGCSNGTF
jgi:hypothetical protein